MNKNDVIEILTLNNWSPQKAKGQNFLIDDDISRKISLLLSPHFDSVLEIGPGLGSLTDHLIKKSESLTAIELDRGYAKYLKEKYPTLNIIEGDFLKYFVPRETKSVISNIPYYITTKIIEKVIIESPNLQVFVFMTQKDLKDRFFAKPNSKQYGPLAILLSLTGTLEQKLIVTVDKFYPTPNVDSAVFRFKRHEVTFDIKNFYSFLKFMFLNRRKTMIKNMKTKFDGELVNNIFKTLDIPLDIRVEALAPERLLEIFRLTKEAQ
jgi:16S rRNA (adenine1518-N6/adenine1519-N6)-dimethyltransferase